MTRVWLRMTSYVERRGIVLFVAAWAVYLLAASLWTHILPPAFHLDLRVFRAGAQAFLDGMPLYDGPLSVGGGYSMPFTYPPIAAVLFIPLTWMSIEVAGVVWTTLSYAALAGVLISVTRQTGRSRREAVWTGVAALCFATALIPVWTTLNLGQISAMLMFLVVVDLLAARPRLPRGMLVGLAAAIKLTPAGFVLFPLIRRDWRTAAWMTGTALGLTIAGAIVAWDDSVAYWSSLGGATERVRVFDGAANIALNGIATRVGSGVTALALAIVLVVMAVIVGVMAMRRQSASGDLGTALMINAVVILLVSPVSWDHHWVWAAPIVLLLALAALRRPRYIGPLFVVTLLVFMIDPGLPGSWTRWVVWGLMYCILLVAIRPDPRVTPLGDAARSSSRSDAG